MRTSITSRTKRATVLSSQWHFTATLAPILRDSLRDSCIDAAHLMQLLDRELLTLKNDATTDRCDLLMALHKSKVILLFLFHFLLLLLFVLLLVLLLLFDWSLGWLKQATVIETGEWRPLNFNPFTWQPFCFSSVCAGGPRMALKLLWNCSETV